MSAPSVAGLMLAAGSLPEIKEAVRSFLGQTYAAKELLIGAGAGSPQRPALERFLATLGEAPIRLLFQEAPSLEELLASTEASLVCEWPVHVSQHPTRLETQVRLMQSLGTEASVFADWMWLHTPERELYWCETAPEEAPPMEGVEDSLLSARALYLQHRGHLAASVSGGASLGSHGIARLTEAGALMVRRIDGPALPDGVRARTKPVAYVRRHRHALRQSLPGHRLPRPYVLQARGEDAQLISLDPLHEDA